MPEILLGRELAGRLDDHVEVVLVRQERERAQRRALHGQHLRVAVDDGTGARGDGPLDVRRGDVLAKAHVDDLAAGGLDGVADAGLALPKEDELVAQFLGVGQHGEQLRLRVAHHAHGAGQEHARRRAGDDVGRLVAGHLRDLAADGLLQVPDGDVFGSGVAHGGRAFPVPCARSHRRTLRPMR